MYYSNKTIKVYIPYNKLDGNYFGMCWHITLYCKAKELDKDDKVCDFTKTDAEIIQKLSTEDLNNAFDFKITLENVAKWLWEQLIPCYKVEIKTDNGKLVVYEEDED